LSVTGISLVSGIISRYNTILSTCGYSVDFRPDRILVQLSLIGHTSTVVREKDETEQF
jgi:hypothetical protein